MRRRAGIPRRFRRIISEGATGFLRSILIVWGPLCSVGGMPITVIIAAPLTVRPSVTGGLWIRRPKPAYYAVKEALAEYYKDE